MRRRIRRPTALLLCLLFCAGLLPARAAGEQTVRIASERDLNLFIENCVIDSYSKQLTVELDADLNLSGYGFKPIPVFCGTFHGNGHTITFQLNRRGSYQGFFRRLEEGAVVEGLTLDLLVSPEGTRSAVGGLAGENKGTIRDCTVIGSVSGDSDTGGLVGINRPEGRLERCTNRAKISGSARTGGIAGSNEGVLSSCVNEGTVNPHAGESESKDAGLLETSTKEAYTDTGGIAGQSTGTIAWCTNRGEIGYPHVGYNAGGIVGIQNGSVLSCVNEGTVHGRKDVGGIVGQFEPSTSVSYGEDPIERLDSALAALSGLFSDLLGEVNATAGDALSDLDQINTTLNEIRDTASTAGTEELHDIEAAMDGLYGSAQEVNTALEVLLDAVQLLSEDANSDISQILNEGKALRQGLSDALKNTDNEVSGILDEVNDSMARIEDSTDVIHNAISHISDYVDLYHRFLTAALNIAGGNYSPSRVPTLDNPSPGGSQSGLGNLIRRPEHLKKLINSFHDRYDRYRASNGGREIEDELNLINDEAAEIPKELHNLSETLRDRYNDMASEVGEAFDQVDRSAARIEQLAGDLNRTARTFNDSAMAQLEMITSCADEAGQIAKNWGDISGDRLGTTLQDVDEKLQDISEQVHQMAGNGSDRNDQMHSTTSAIISQLDEVRRAANDLTDPPEKTVSDISDDSAEEGADGRVISCRNSGSIQGDSNVGGIAGIMAPEVLEDPEEDLDLDLEDDKLLVDMTTFLRATVRDCTGTGEVIARNDCAGGIAGRCEVGAVLNCVSQGKVESTDGGTCGGIAGLSRSLIRSCAAQSDLTGGDLLGGIAGQGRDIQNCVAMTQIDSTGEKLGAIAGEADGEVLNNFFLEEDLAGLDGIDYEGKAVPLSFEAFSALEGVPESFLSFAITFQAEGQTIAVLPVEYGGSLDPAQFPEVPIRDGGDYGAWEAFSYRRILRSRTVSAVYSDWLTTISSGGDHPILLADGAFSPDALLTLQEQTVEAVPPDGYHLAALYAYAISSKTSLPAQVTLRVSTQGLQRAGAIAVLDGDGALRLVQTSSDGSYLLFPAGTSGSFALLEQEGPSQETLLLLAGGGAALIALLLFLRCRKRRRGGGGAQKAGQASQGKKPLPSPAQQPQDQTPAVSQTEPVQR